MHARTWLTGMQRKPSITHLCMLIPWPRPHITRSILSSFGQIRFVRPGAPPGLLAAGLSRSVAPFLFAAQGEVPAHPMASQTQMGQGTGGYGALLRSSRPGLPLPTALALKPPKSPSMLLHICSTLVMSCNFLLIHVLVDFASSISRTLLGQA